MDFRVMVLNVMMSMSALLGFTGVPKKKDAQIPKAHLNATQESFSQFDIYII